MALSALNSAALRDCFMNIIRGNKISLDLKELEQMISQDFQINSVNSELASALPYFLVFKMENWPGWDKYPQYMNNKLILNDWFEEFVKFLHSKLDEAVHIHYKSIVSNKESCEHASAQTEMGCKSFAPYSINVRGNPSLLNTLIFENVNDKDVKLITHDAMDSEAFLQMSLSTLLNWPFAGVHLFCPVFCISRKNVHFYDRHLSLGNDKMLTPVQAVFIERAERNKLYVTIDTVMELYSTLNVLIMKAFPPSTNSNFKIFAVLLEELMADIKDIQMLEQGKPSIGSFVRFNIGKHVYVRSNSNSGCTQPVACYTEVTTPMVEIAIRRMGTAKEINSYIGSLNGADISLTNVPSVYFSCNFCSVTFHCSQLLLNHFIHIHKMTPPMKCSACGVTYNAVELAENRWGHPCASKSNNGSCVQS
ncbi:uncharacterized protein LOC109534171 [Dendroctonus ponderosae]|uniref:uncharacterized protein LOC109534171 n=1 Tax=Dendroctonus ponderosae TaxID=77166 RepID=UPI0020364163|nr:uncharacterized protein LOC109534171 [Dendroctonus ponderosae]KAH1027952.1 hypothetical protein HUJ05_001369 [Dendroctonus ponderosae]